MKGRKLLIRNKTTSHYNVNTIGLSNKHLTFNLKEKTMKSIFLLYVFCFVQIQFTFAQSFEKANPANVGFIAERLERNDNTIKSAIDNGEIPGAVALVARKGKIVYHKSFGYADMDSKKPMELNSIFRLAGMSRQITVIGALVLHERGHFMLTDPISKYLPEFSKPEIVVEVDAEGNVVKTKPSQNEIKIIDLLTSSGGFGYTMTNHDLQKAYKKAGIIEDFALNVQLKDQMQILSKLPLLFEPGSQYQLGLSHDVLGYLCEVISGKPLDRFLSDEVLGPLKMSDTYFHLPTNKKNKLVTLYSWIEDKGLVEYKIYDTTSNPNYPIEGAKTYFSGGGGLSSTVYDYSRFIQMLLNNGELDGIRIISRKSVELLRRPRIDRNNDGDPDYSFGFNVINDIAKNGRLGSDGIYHYTGGFYTTFWIDPQENLIGVFMSQVSPRNTIVRHKFRTLVYQALE
jgi:CubicO group peptidase (beta-lactamase class C family)